MKTILLCSLLCLTACREDKTDPSLYDYKNAYMMCPNFPIIKGELYWGEIITADGDKFIPSKECTIVVPKKSDKKDSHA